MRICTRGRPKGTASFKSDLLEELSETIAVREGGSEVRITKRRAIVNQLVAASIGNPKAATALINLCAKLFRDQEADPRAAEDEAFVDKLAARERQAEIDTDSSPSPEEPEK